MSLLHSKWYLKAKRHWLTVIFLLGFVTDYLLLNRIDDKFDNAILLFYVVLATGSLLLFYVGVSDKWGYKWSPKLLKYTPPLMQYSFGGLLSGMLIFYGRLIDCCITWEFILLVCFRTLFWWYQFLLVKSEILFLSEVDFWRYWR